MQARRGELVDAIGGAGLVALDGSTRIGLVGWHLEPERSAEITVLVVIPGSTGRGVGRALLEAAAARLREQGLARVWLVTTNENLAALALYQKAGYRLTALRPGAIDAVRRTIKPEIPKVSANGIPIRDELELSKEL